MGNSISSTGYQPTSLMQCFSNDLQFDIELYSLYRLRSASPFSTVNEQIKDCFKLADEELLEEKKTRGCRSVTSSSALFRDDNSVIKKLLPLTHLGLSIMSRTHHPATKDSTNNLVDTFECHMKTFYNIFLK